MSKEYGYIKVYRSLLENVIWKDKPYSKGQAWLELIMLANHTDKKILINGKVDIVKRGQIFTNRRELADRWGWSTKKVDNFIKLLKTEEMVTAKGTTNGITLTIENYGFYQSKGDTVSHTRDTSEDTAEATSEDTAEGTQNKKKKNKNNKKNNKNSNITPKTDVSALILDFSEDDEIQNFLLKWLDIRKKKRLLMDEEVIRLNLAQVNPMAEKSKLTVKEYLSEIIRRSWGTFYEIPPKKKPEPEAENHASYDLDEFKERSLYGEIKYERKKKA